MQRATRQPGQEPLEQIALLIALLSELLEEMATGDAPRTWAKIMAFIKPPEVIP